jgi:maltooligosyltrehalose trehalohydrolase
MPSDTYDDLLGARYARGETRFRVWAPEAKSVEIVFEGSQRRLKLEPQSNGYFAARSTDAPPGTMYRYTVDNRGPWPDPYSRFQPQGVHGPSMVVDADAFQWTDKHWRGTRLEGQVLYELHIGTFTPVGTFDSAIERLGYLRELGITVIEVMPVAECPGRFNWGYDGVQLFAPYHAYGDYDAFKRFIDAAHAEGVAVILDVVYNHLGPDGNYAPCFSPHFLSKRHKTEWGEALNFDDEHSNGARDFVLQNVRHWIGEFHLDGLRLDATQSIFDSSARHILADLVETARAAAAPKDIIITAENEPQCSEHLLSPQRGGFGIDGMWNDDFHHSASVALRGSRDGYMRDYTGRAQELLSCAKYGFLYQGQRYGWQNKARGSPLKDVPASACITFIDNHDQVANHFLGDRIHARAAPATYRAMAALLLLAPQTPLLFMGQEFAASTRFMFFADHNPELRSLVHNGRREFVAQFKAYSDPAVQALMPDPSSENTFLGSKLNWQQAEDHAEALAFHRDLIALRKSDEVLRRPESYVLDGATLNEKALVLRWSVANGSDRLLILNLDQQLMLDAIPEPLIAPPRGTQWSLLWSSEDARYGGHGVIPPMEEGGRGRWNIAAQSAVLLRAVRSDVQTPATEKSA